MNQKLAIFVVSLAANVLLAVTLTHQQPRATGVAGDSRSDSTTALFPQRTKTPPAAANVIVQEVPIRWSQLESENYADYIKRLRAFGVPETVIRDIIVADIHKLYRPRLMALRPPVQMKTNFWTETWWRRSGRPTKEQRAQYAALQKEERELVQTLLGKDVYLELARDSGRVETPELFFGSIPEEKQEAVSDILKHFEEESSALNRDANDFYDPQIRDVFKALRQAKHDELAKLLTPEQLKDFEFQNSDAAEEMRYALGPMSPSEAEFDAIANYRKTMNDFEASLDHSDEGSSPNQQREAYRDKEKALKDAMAATLGPQRYREYIASTSYTYQNLLASGVSMENVIKVADVKKEVEEATKKIRNNKSLTEEQRTEALAAVKTETMKTLTDLLGKRRAESYPGSGGNWVRRIVPSTDGGYD